MIMGTKELAIKLRKVEQTEGPKTYFIPNTALDSDKMNKMKNKEFVHLLSAPSSPDDVGDD